MTHPVLYSFRRCPYAMRARLGLASAGQTVSLREIVLSDKPADMLKASPKGTVPVLVGDTVIDESLDIMVWALGRSDPEGLLDRMTDASHALIAHCDGPFKTALDLTKYAVRHPDTDPAQSRMAAAEFIKQLDTQLDGTPWLFGDQPCMADFAILPFVRQFAHTNLTWWDAQPLPHVQNWLAAFKTSGRFKHIMTKYTPWKDRNDVILFP